MYVDIRSRIGQGIWIQGEFDTAVFSPLASVLTPGGTMLDVGANVGYYGIMALDYVGAGGHVHAFEVDPRPLRCLRKTVKRFALHQIHVHETAVGGTCGQAYLRQDAECGNSFVSLTPTPGKLVSITTLDAWFSRNPINRLDAIKVDVEGMELDVLQGAEDLIKMYRPAIIVEADALHQARNCTSLILLTQWLSNHNYTWYDVPDCWTQTLFARSN